MLEVAGGTNEKVALLAATDFSYAVAEGERCHVLLPGPGFVYAPVAEDADAGFAYVMIEGKALGQIPVVYADTVELHRIQKRSWWEKLFGGRDNETEAAKNTVIPGRGLPSEG
jgi:hypothetical protein